MIEANKGASEDTLRRLKEASYERFRVQLIKAVEKLLEDFEMTWDDLAKKLQWRFWDRYSQSFERGKVQTGQDIKTTLGTKHISLFALNDIAHVFSMEPYILFKPRFPYVGT